MEADKRISDVVVSLMLNITGVAAFCADWLSWFSLVDTSNHYAVTVVKTAENQCNNYTNWNTPVATCRQILHS